MSYKILHFADLQLDASFAGQGFPVEYGNERRLDLRAAFTRILARARELKVNAVTIGGDLFVQDYLLPETADFILQQLSLLAPIRVVIAPGEMDPYTNESPYSRLNWPENVDIFYQGKLAHCDLAPDIHIWGASNPPARGVSLFEGWEPSQGVNILLLHAVRKNARSDIHTIDLATIRKAGFRLALLGGEHSGVMDPSDNPLLVYPGSPEPLAPVEETNPHQVVLAEVDGEQVRIQTISFQQWHYRSVEVDLTHCTSNAEVARRIDAILETEITAAPHAAFTVTLTGQVDFDLNISALRPLVQAPIHYRLYSGLKIGYDLEKLALEQTVRGLLVQRFLERINHAQDDAEKHRQLNALHFALQALDGKQVSLYETNTN